MFLISSVFIILYCFQHQQAVADYPILVCQYNGFKYRCVTYKYNHTEGKHLHPDICLKEEDCQSCVKQWITKAAIRDHHHSYSWVSPQHFTVKQRDDSTGLGTRYACSDSVGECACQLQNCTGTIKYCQQNECYNTTKCFCTPVSTYNLLYLLHKGTEYTDVPLTSFMICKYRIPSKVKIVGLPVCRLLSDESAAFIEQDVTVRFNDPVITVSTAGTVVIRKDGLERVFAMADPLGQIVVPEELLLDSGTLKIIFVTTRGETVTGSVKIEGRKFCTRLTCLLCIQVWYQLNCLPPVIRYVLYVVLTIITILLILYIHKVVKVIWQTGVGIYHLGRQLIRLCKTVGRFSLLTGLVAGGSSQRLLDRARLGMEDRARQLAQNAQPRQQRLPLTAILVLFTLISIESVHAECTNHLVLKTEVKDCHQSKAGQHCKITTNAQITLLNLEYSQCICS